MVTKEFKSKVIEALAAARENFEGSDSKFSTSLGINPAQYSRIKRGDTDRVLSEPQWITLARILGVSIYDEPQWQTANTPVYQFIYAQLRACQDNSMSAILCDLADIGKTYTARRYAEENKCVAYIDCSQVKTRSKLIRAIARAFGSDYTSLYSNVYKDLVYYLKTLPHPLIILDEAGDLDYEAFLEIKALWNATELCCGFYMMGADGLREKIRRSIDCKKVGYAEIFSRFGRRFGRVVPVEKEERDRLLRSSAAMIVKANNPQADVNAIVRRTIGDDDLPSLRRIYKELSKTSTFQTVPIVD